MRVYNAYRAIKSGKGLYFAWRIFPWQGFRFKIFFSKNLTTATGKYNKWHVVHLAL